MKYMQPLLCASKIDFNKEVKKSNEFKNLATWVGNKVDDTNRHTFFTKPFMLNLGYYILYLESHNIAIGLLGNGYLLSYIDPLKTSHKVKQLINKNPLEIIIREQSFPTIKRMNDLFKLAILDSLNLISKSNYL